MKITDEDANALISALAARGYVITGPKGYDTADRGQAIIKALEAALALAPPAETWRDPTGAMLDAARDWSYRTYGKPIGNDAAVGCWQAMLSALIPSPPNPQDAVARNKTEIGVSSFAPEHGVEADCEARLPVPGSNERTGATFDSTALQRARDEGARLAWEEAMARAWNDATEIQPSQRPAWSDFIIAFRCQIATLPSPPIKQEGSRL